MQGHQIPVYRSIFGILNLAGRLATSSPSKSSHTIPPSDTLNCLILCSSLSMCAWTSSEIETTTMEGGGATSVWLCKINGVGCGTIWPSGGRWWYLSVLWSCLTRRERWWDSGIYYTLSWTGICWAYCSSILWPRLVMASWIEAIVVMNWSTVTTCKSISVWSNWSNTLINLPLTLIQEAEPKLNVSILLQ